MNQTNEPVALKPVSYANPQDILDYKNSYMVRESKTNFHTVPLYTKDQVDVIMQAAIAHQNQEAELLQSQSEPVAYEYRHATGNQWNRCTEFVFHQQENNSNYVQRKLYDQPPLSVNEQPQTVKEALEKAAKLCENNQINWADAVWSRAVNSCAEKIRALIDQPAIANTKAGE